MSNLGLGSILLVEFPRELIFEFDKEFDKIFPIKPPFTDTDFNALLPYSHQGKTKVRIVTEEFLEEAPQFKKYAYKLVPLDINPHQ
jgi:hypothetical protein